ncbi:MAG: putative beta-galactosidase [Paenibacillaceae bacterium]|jgi:beta-galactosidase|nr:putative beta-galactosidase [Paenibacillaceae bacterium]
MTPTKRLLCGSSYYPERFPREQWENDARLMKQAGFHFIRTGEFAWSKFEPQEGVFDFSWMDEALGVFAAQGLKVILCTPTASPMPWIMAKYPDAIPFTGEGKPFNPGQRRNYCFNNRNYRYYADRITAKMAEHYGNHPALKGWQIDNELGGEEFICHCEVCRRSFQHWLKQRYGSLSELNRRWGGTFFSFEFTDWSEIPVPLGHNVHLFNPSLRKDYLLFYSDSMKDFLFSQFSILKQRTGSVPVTTNRYTLFWTDKYDHTMDAGLDTVSFDNYDLEPSLASFHHDFYRSIKKTTPFWVLEQCTGFQEFGMDPEQTRLQIVEAFARGADIICGFSWRQISYGGEQDFQGIVDYDGTPGEVYGVYKRTNEWLQGEGQSLAKLRMKNDTAILHSYESSMTYHTIINTIVDYHRELYHDVYIPLFELGIGVDFIFSLDELPSYKMVMVPFHVTETKESLEKLQQFAASGGTVIITGDFMQKSRDNWQLYGDDRKPLERLTGLDLRKWQTVKPPSSVKLASSLSNEGHMLDKFFQKIKPNGESINVLAYVTAPESEKGTPAVAENCNGGGRVVFLAGIPDQKLMKRILQRSADQLQLEPVELPAKTEMIRLYDDSNRLAAFFVLNKNEIPITVRLPGEHASLTVGPNDFILHQLPHYT